MHTPTDLVDAGVVEDGVEEDEDGQLEEHSRHLIGDGQPLHEAQDALVGLQRIGLGCGDAETKVGLSARAAVLSIRVCVCRRVRA